MYITAQLKRGLKVVGLRAFDLVASRDELMARDKLMAEDLFLAALQNLNTTTVRQHETIDRSDFDGHRRIERDRREQAEKIRIASMTLSTREKLDPLMSKQVALTAARNARAGIRGAGIVGNGLGYNTLTSPAP